MPKTVVTTFGFGRKKPNGTEKEGNKRRTTEVEEFGEKRGEWLSLTSAFSRGELLRWETLVWFCFGFVFMTDHGAAADTTTTITDGRWH